MDSIIDRYYKLSVQGIQDNWFKKEISEKWYDYVINLPAKLKVTYLITVLHNQVMNGGFDQYFTNGYGQFSLDTVKSLLDIQANKKAFILNKAFDLVNKDGYDDKTFRNKLLTNQIRDLFDNDDLIDALDVLSDEYYTAEEEENTFDLLSEYLENV